MKSLRMVLQLREPPYPKASFGRNFFQWIAVAGIVATCFSISAGAQGGQSRPTFPGTTPPGFTSGVAISGVVTQADRAAGGASVQIQNLTTGMTAQAVTRADGSFEFSNLLPGEYVVTSTLGTDRVQNQVSLSSMGAPELHINLPGRPAQAQPGASGAAVSVQELQVPEQARSALDEAHKALQRGDAKLALDKVQQALAIAPGFAQALAMRAALSLAEGNTAQALSDAQTATRSDPGYALSFFVLASALNQTGRYPDAAQAAQQGVRLDPRAWQGHFELGHALAGQNKWSDALPELNAATESLPPKFVGLYLVRAVTLINLQRFVEAEKDLQEVLRRDPGGAAGIAAQKLLAQLPAGSRTGSQ